MMKSVRKRWIGGLLLVLLMGVAAFACTTPAGRTAGEVVDDGTITTKVKALLYEDDFLRGVAISVQTFDGKVTLIGAVDTYEHKRRAESIARSVHGVRGVNNNLEIKKN